MLQKLKKFARGGTSFMVLASATGATALADCGGFNTDDMNKGLVGFLNVITGVPFYAGAGIALAVGVWMIFFDGGHAPQFAKVIVGIIAGVMLVMAVIGWLMSKAACGSFSAGS